MRSTLALALGGILALSQASAKDRALVVGVDHYPRLTLRGASGAKDLGGAVFDAQTFARLLTSEFGYAPETIKQLIDGQASREAILGTFKSWLIEGTEAGDRVAFYFAGHGAAIAVPDGQGGMRETSSLVPADAAGELAAEPPHVDNLILGPDINELLASIPDRQVFVMADACQSGSVTRELSAVPSLPQDVKVRTLTPDRLLNIASRDITERLQRQVKVDSRLISTENDNLVVWHAATLAQVTFDYPGRSGGVFTQSFADGLKGKAATSTQGAVTAGSLLHYVQGEAGRICQQLGRSCKDGLTPGLDFASPRYLASVLAPQGGTLTPPDATPYQVVSAQADALFTHHNDFDLAVDILPGAALKRGQQVQFRVRSAASGHLVLFDTAPDGSLTQIFPNPKSETAHKGGTVRGGAPMTVPDASYGFAFTARSVGPSSLIAIVAEDGADFEAIVPAVNGLKAVSSRLLDVIAAKLDTPVLDPSPEVPNRAARWAFVRAPYTVE